MIWATPRRESCRPAGASTVLDARRWGSVFPEGNGVQLPDPLTHLVQVSEERIEGVQGDRVLVELGLDLPQGAQAVA